MSRVAVAVRLRLTALAAVVVAAVAAVPAQAMTIEQVTSPGGIHAWLVRSTSVPLVAINFAFRGGSSQDPGGKAGTANMVSDLLDEGAGPYDSNEMHEQLDDRAIQYRFNAGRDYFRGTLRTLKTYLPQAARLWHLMLTYPHFDKKPVERIRAQLHALLIRRSHQPGSVAAAAWWAAAFPNHPYGRDPLGSLDTLAHITIADLKAYRAHVFARDGLTVAVVGDVSKTEAGKLLDTVFGGLATKAELKPVPDAKPQGLGERIVRPLDVPQASVVFGGVGVPRSDPDFIAAYLDNYILGGGTFASRLYKQVREKRGLAYTVDEALDWKRHTALVIGSTGTRSDRTAEALSIIEREIKRMRDLGPTPDELAKAKSYVKGAYVLTLDTSTSIAAQLVQIQLDRLGIDYIQRRDKLIDAVTLADAKRAAKRLYQGGVLVTIAGHPRGLTSSKTPGD